MIQTLTYRARVEDGDSREILSELNRRIAKMISTRPMLLGGTASAEGTTVCLQLRINGLDRWKVAREGRLIATFLLSVMRLKFYKPLSPELITTELTRNKLVVGEGRTPMRRPPRTSPLPT